MGGGGGGGAEKEKGLKLGPDVIIIQGCSVKPGMQIAHSSLYIKLWSSQLLSVHWLVCF